MLFTVSIMCNLQGIDYEKYYWAICGGGILILMFYIEYKLKFGEKKF
jgi:hypothetical protein